jgi:hypothetical protein
MGDMVVVVSDHALSVEIFQEILDGLEKEYSEPTSNAAGNRITKFVDSAGL